MAAPRTTTETVPRPAGVGSPAGTPVAGPVDVVVGPKTRLGAEILHRVGAAGGRTLALARHERDAADLAGRDDLLAADASAEAFRAALGAGPVRIHVCALGPLHPGPTDPAHADAVRRELVVVDRLLDAADGREVSVVLVSTVIALAPGNDRRYYGGWKGVAEESLRELVDRHPRARLSVLYPGRLLGARRTRRPWELAYTSHRRLATLALSTAQGPARGRVVGADARAWLLLRSARVGLAGLTGRPGTGRAAVPPRAHDHRERDE
jgi:hypothetical protein